MNARAVFLYHLVLVDDQERQGQLLDAGEALELLAEAIGAQLCVKQVRGEPCYVLSRCQDRFELSLIAGHLYDNRETLSLAIELRYQETLITSCGCSRGIERIKLGSGSAWLRTPGGLQIILGEGPGGLLEVQD